jgi:hypothetical protein
MGLVNALSRRATTGKAQLKNGLTLLLCTNHFLQWCGIGVDAIDLAHVFAPAAAAMA